MAAVRLWLEYVAAWLALHAVGLLPRPMARRLGAGVTLLFYWCQPRLRRAAMFNLRLAFPDWNDEQRKRTARRLIRNLGWMGGEFSQFLKHTRESIREVVVLDGLENFLAAQARGKGVLFLTGHMGAWELAPFAQALYGHPLHFLVRPIENPRVDALISGYRNRAGNQLIDKNQSARAMLKILQAGGTAGILMDQNTSLDEGVFVDFFGVPACTSSGMARIALRTDAAVVPGYAYWDQADQKYHLRLEPALELVRTGDTEADVVANTARFTRVVEDFARRFPDQWLWVHKRWKTRPPGEKPLYPF